MTGQAAGPQRPLLTFRLDAEQRQRLKARLAREDHTMSEVVTHGMRQYVTHARNGDDAGHPVSTVPASGPATGPAAGFPVVPERIAARLRELRSSGRSEL